MSVTLFWFIPWLWLLAGDQLVGDQNLNLGILQIKPVKEGTNLNHKKKVKSQKFDNISIYYTWVYKQALLETTWYKHNTNNSFRFHMTVWKVHHYTTSFLRGRNSSHLIAESSAFLSRVILAYQDSPCGPSPFTLQSDHKDWTMV